MELLLCHRCNEETILIRNGARVCLREHFGSSFRWVKTCNAGARKWMPSVMHGLTGGMKDGPETKKLTPLEIQRRVEAQKLAIEERVKREQRQAERKKKELEAERKRKNEEEQRRKRLLQL